MSLPTHQGVLWEKKSRYANLTCIDTEQGPMVVKEIKPAEVNSGNAPWIKRVSLAYRALLRELRVPLVEPYFCFEQDDKAIQMCPYRGHDLEYLVSTGAAPDDWLLHLVEAIKGPLRSNSRQAGIDARLSNFCFNPDNGKYYYVDTFPALLRYEGEHIVHFPNPTDSRIIEQELVRKFDPMGILRRLRFGILEMDVGIGEADLLNAVEMVLGGDFRRSTAAYFASLPDNLSRADALDGMSLSDPDGIREVALKYMPAKGPSRMEFLRRVFDLSSNFCPEAMADEVRLSMIRGLLVPVS